MLVDSYCEISVMVYFTPLLGAQKRVQPLTIILITTAYHAKPSLLFL